MSYSLSFRPEVEDDAVSGYLWYEEKATDLGEEFLRMFYACAREIPRNPFLYRKVYKDFSRCLLKRFPYAIYFRIQEQQVVVFGLFHCARNPVILKKELRDRENINH
jgi:hypothetical protein